jgi:hypothetical protein
VEVASGKSVADFITTERNVSAVLLQPGVDYKFTVVSRNKVSKGAAAAAAAESTYCIGQRSC